MRWNLAASLALGLLSPIMGVLASDPTDTLMDGDSAQSGYLPNHNMDPAVLSGGSFGQIWRFTAPTPSNGLQEQFYAKPLVYTPSSFGRQVVLAFSEQNKLYVLDAVNGTLYASRDLSREGESPFLVSDLGSCNDISGTIGITGTPVIDPATDTVYFWAKSYLQPGQTGFRNGAYRFHAVDAVTLVERAGFPKNLQGQPADNDNARSFTGGTVLQRASLNLINGVIYAGFGGHCDQYNYTGWLVGMGTDGSVKAAYATVGGDGVPVPDQDSFQAGGGAAGIWQSGAAIASDNNGRLFFATGNGNGRTVNQGQPASGRKYLSTLSECMVNLAIKPDGSVTQQDYFEPYEYLALDAGDRDLGSGAVCLPDSGTFSGGGVSRLAITVGKNGKMYITDADNMGGYKLGPGGGDKIVQSISMPGGGSVFGQVGTYPLEGGFIYVTPVGYPTLVYGLGHTASGLPSFTLVAQSNDSSAGRVGVGPATITTLKGQAGTAILWVVDVDAGIRAYHAVPVNGQLVPIPLPASPAVSKFQRPAFGDGRYYLATSNGNILAFGSPVALPLNCTSPLNFGSVAIGNSSTVNVTCQANIAITKLNGFILGKAVFQASNSSLPTGPLSKGQQFTFPVSFNLTNFQLTGGSTSAPSVSPGVQTTSISISTTNAVTGYASEQPITLTGTTVSSGPFITMSPLEIDFLGIVINSSAAEDGSDGSFVVGNSGQAVLTITNVTYTEDAVNPDPGEEAPQYTPVRQITNEKGETVWAFDDDGHFTAKELPQIGTKIQPGQFLTFPVNFNADNIANYYTILRFESDGGSAYSIFTGSASTSPVAKLEYTTGEGGGTQEIFCTTKNAEGDCISTVDFGDHAGLSQSTISLVMSNNGGSAMKITKSKPPEGQVLGAENPNTDLHEGQVILPGDNATAKIFFDPGTAILNADPVSYSGAWTLNTDDLSFGVHIVNFTGRVISNQTGPLDDAKIAIYKYLGCYIDNTNGRIEAKQSVSQSMTNGACQTTAYNAGAVFAGTEFQTECWYGSVIPDASLKAVDSQCSYNCGGDSNQICGGLGGYISVYYDSTRYFPANGTIIGTTGKGPQIVKSAGQYSYAGCWTDNVGGRALNKKTTVNNNMTVENCAAACAGYSVFGVEYGQECYCDAIISAASTQKADTDCNMLCAGSEHEYCGAGSRLSVYTLNGVSPNVTNTQSATQASSTSTVAVVSSGTATTSTSTSSSATPSSAAYSFIECHTDKVAARTLTGKTVANASVTVELCAAFCTGFTYFGLEYANECYCGNTPATGSSAATDGRCSMACAGNSAEICGGPDGLSLYAYNPVSSSSSVSSGTVSSSAAPSATSMNATGVSSVASSTAASSTAVSSTAASSSSSSTPTPTSILDSYLNLGCVQDNNVANRALKGAVFNAQDMTLERCAGNCSSYAYFGVEYGVECYCGNAITPVNATDGRCNVKCGGNAEEICGGGYGLNLYKFAPQASSSATAAGSATSVASSTATSVASSIVPSTSTTSATPTPTGPVIVQTVGNYSYLDCHSDNTTIRTLQGTAKFSADMTVERCAGNCTGYTYFGIEYSQECYCSNSLVFGSSATTDGRCNMKCGGNPLEICGGPNGLSLYMYNATLAAGTASSSSSAVLSSSSVPSSSVQQSSASTGASSGVAASSASPSAATASSSLSSTPGSTPATSIAASSSPASSSVVSSAATLSEAASSSAAASSAASLPAASSAPVASSATSSSIVASSLASSSGAASSAASSAAASSSAVSASSSSAVSASSSTPPSASATPSSSPWAYVGCANDTTTGRALSAAATTNTTGMTVEYCQNYCMSKNMPLAGVEYGSECYCGMSLGFNSSTGFTGCSMACAGNSSQTCGGPSRLNVYNYTLYIPPVIVPRVQDFTYQGCYPDNVGGRTLGAYSFANTTAMTAEMCVASCGGRGYAYAGLEYTSECWCANKLAAGVTAVSDDTCRRNLCPGNKREYCGPGNYLIVYQNQTSTTTTSSRLRRFVEEWI